MPADFRTEIMPYLNDRHKHRYEESYKSEFKLKKQDLLDFIKGLHGRMAPGAPFPHAIENANRNLLDRYAYNLVLFRACMADKTSYQREAGKAYLDLLLSRNELAQDAPNAKGQMYLRNLSAGNPFLIKQHVSELFKIIQENPALGLPKETVKKYSEEVEIHLMAMIEHLDPAWYQSQQLLLTGFRELLLNKLADTYFPDDKKEPEILELFCQNAKELLLAAKEVTSDQSLELYNDASLIRDFPLGDTVDATLALIDDMQSKSATLRA